MDGGKNTRSHRPITSICREQSKDRDNRFSGERQGSQHADEFVPNPRAAESAGEVYSGINWPWVEDDEGNAIHWQQRTIQPC